MQKKNCFSKGDKENQAKNILLSINDNDDIFQQFENEPSRAYSNNIVIKPINKCKYTFFQRLSKSKQKRRCLKEIRANSNSDMKTTQSKKIGINKYLLASQKTNEYPLQTIQQLKKILEKLQSKQLKQTQKAIHQEKNQVQFKKINRINSVNNKKRNLSFINNKSQNRLQITVANETQHSNLILIKKCKNKEQHAFFNENQDQISRRKYSLGINYLKSDKQINNKQSILNQIRGTANIKNNVDNLSSKTLNILHELNNLKTLNCKKRQKFHIKINKKSKILNSQHFLSVRI